LANLLVSGKFNHSPHLPNALKNALKACIDYSLIPASMAPQAAHTSGYVTGANFAEDGAHWQRIRYQEGRNGTYCIQAIGDVPHCFPVVVANTIVRVFFSAPLTIEFIC
jgi:hypothetical protein